MDTSKTNLKVGFGSNPSQPTPEQLVESVQKRLAEKGIDDAVVEYKIRSGVGYICVSPKLPKR